MSEAGASEARMSEARVSEPGVTVCVGRAWLHLGLTLPLLPTGERHMPGATHAQCLNRRATHAATCPSSPSSESFPFLPQIRLMTMCTSVAARLGVRACLASLGLLPPYTGPKDLQPLLCRAGSIGYRLARSGHGSGILGCRAA
jgi:hypothetical protein